MPVAQSCRMGYCNQSCALTTRRKSLVALVIGVLLFLGAMTTMFVDPVKIISKLCARITPGSYVHSLLLQPLDGIHISTYLFNVTNAEAFLAGKDHRLRVQEVGPFTYQELRYNLNLQLDIERGVMRYTPHYKLSFLPEESIGRPEHINITLPNIALLGMSTMMADYNYILQMGFNLLTNRLSSQPIVRMSAKDYMWGYNEPLISLGNNFLPGWISFDTLGIMDRMYDKKLKFLVEVITSNADKLMIKSVNRSRGLKQWNFDRNPSKCNSFQDTYEALGYPTDLTPDRPIRIYRNILCRFLELDYQERTTTDYGVEALVYKVSNKTFSLNNDTRCLCGRRMCIDGLSDLSPCLYGLPLALSNAHFMYADPKLYERIEGMNPNESDHGSAVVIEPIIGVALSTCFSVQVNIVVKDVSFNPQSKMFSNMVVPIAYFKAVQPSIPSGLVYRLRLMYIGGPYILLSVQIILLLTSLILISYAIRHIFLVWICSRKTKISFYSPQENIPKTSPVEMPLIKS